MPSHFQKFEWAVCKDGYEMEEIAPPRKVGSSREVCGQVYIRAKSSNMEPYKPSKETSRIHREFASLAENKSAIFSFVSKYGLLGISENSIGSEEYEEILLYKQLVKKIITQLNKDNIAESAKIFNKNVSPSLTAEIHALESKSSLQAKRGIFQIYPIPRSLIAFIWLSIADEITNGRSWQKCLTCGDDFEIGKDTGGTKRKAYCKGSCRQQAYRERQKKKK